MKKKSRYSLYNGMDKEYYKQLKEMDEFATQKWTKQQAIDFLYKAGICTKIGRLRKYYK